MTTQIHSATLHPTFRSLAHFCNETDVNCHTAAEYGPVSPVPFLIRQTHFTPLTLQDSRPHVRFLCRVDRAALVNKLPVINVNRVFMWARPLKNKN